jgi:hypothetical protein
MVFTVLVSLLLLKAVSAKPHPNSPLWHLTNFSERWWARGLGLVSESNSMSVMIMGDYMGSLMFLPQFSYRPRIPATYSSYGPA